MRALDPMLPLEEIYDETFFREFGPENLAYKSACELISDILHEHFRPQTLVDWGCGAGIYAAHFARLGSRVLAVDGVPRAAEYFASLVGELPGHTECQLPEFVRHDLRTPLGVELSEQRYDLSLCLDVMEHLYERDAEQALDNILHGTEIAILSCAPKHQGGHHHVNEQPRRYWIAKMAQRGWDYDKRTTGKLRDTFLARRDTLTQSWMYTNIAVYRRG